MARLRAETRGAWGRKAVACVLELSLSKPGVGARPLRHIERAWIQGIPGSVRADSRCGPSDIAGGGTGRKRECGHDLVRTLRRFRMVQKGICKAGGDGG